MGGNMPFIYKNRFNRRIASGSYSSGGFRVGFPHALCLELQALLSWSCENDYSNEVSWTWLNVDVGRQRGPKAGAFLCRSPLH